MAEVGVDRGGEFLAPGQQGALQLGKIGDPFGERRRPVAQNAARWFSRSAPKEAALVTVAGAFIEISSLPAAWRGPPRPVETG